MSFSAGWMHPGKVHPADGSGVLRACAESSPARGRAPRTTCAKQSLARASPAGIPPGARCRPSSRSLDVVPVGAAGLSVVDVGEPPRLRRHLGQALELARGCALLDCRNSFDEGSCASKSANRFFPVLRSLLCSVFRSTRSTAVALRACQHGNGLFPFELWYPAPRSLDQKMRHHALNAERRHSPTRSTGRPSERGANLKCITNALTTMHSSGNWT